MVWSDWEYALATPELESLRASRVLMKQSGDLCVMHCLAIREAFFFGVCGKIENPSTIIDLAGNNPMDPDVAAVLGSDNFRFDIPCRISWNRLTEMIYAICNGLSLKFNPTSDEERTELAHNALEQTLLKIRRGKLKFTPGKAPVFNLLTTAIIRMMCSIKNKEKRHRNNQSKLVHDVQNKATLPRFRSLAIAGSLR